MIQKLLSYTFVSLGMAQTLLADAEPQEPCCPSVIVGDPLDPCCINAVYPYPANYAPCCGWDIYAKGDFLYLSSSVDSHTNPAGNFSFDGTATKWFFPNTSYRPGFRISLGVDLDSAVFDLTYLRYHSHTTKTYNARANSGVALTVASPSYFSLISGQPRAFFQRVKNIRHIDVDFVIASLKRPVYLGRRILMDLNYGIMGMWIGQQWRFNCTAFTTPIPPVGVTADGVYKTHHKSWSVGPNLGFEATALLLCHFHVLTSIALSIQYAEMYKVNTTSAFPNYPGPLGRFHIKKKGTIAHLQAYHFGEIGIGWGDYLGCDDRYHLNFSVTYTWLFQHIYDNGLFGIPTGWDDLNHSSLSIHGIAIGGRVDF